MNYKTITITCLFAVSSLSLTSCTDEEVALGAGVIGGAIIGHEIGRHNNDRHNYGHYRHRDRRHYYDHGGYRGGHGRGRYNMFMVTDNFTEDYSFSKEALLLSQKYLISNDAAETLVDALYLAQNKDLSGLQELGLQSKDLVNLKQGILPSESAQTQMAQVLELTGQETLDLLKNMIKDVHEETTRSGFLD